MLQIIKRIPWKFWAFFGSIISFFGYMYSDEIKSWLSNLLNVQLPAFDWITLLFVLGILVGVFFFALGLIDDWLKKIRTSGLVLRKDLKSLETFFEKAESEIFIHGYSLEKVARQNSDVIKGLIERGVHMTFLILNPRSTYVSGIEKAMDSSNLIDGINASLGILWKIKTDLPEAQRNRLQIMTYDFFPLNSMIFIDPRKNNGRMKVEYGYYKADPNLRPNFFISKEIETILFQAYWESYQFLLGNSQEYIQ